MSSAVVDTLYALLQVLADDPDTPKEALVRYVQRRAREAAGYGLECCWASALLDKRAQALHGARFAALSPADREHVLDSLLASYPHPLSQPQRARRMKVTWRNFYRLLERPSRRRLRKLVVADLLSYYYTTARGWAVVDYPEFPGYARVEREPCEVRGVRLAGSTLILELSDATYDSLRPQTLRVEEDGSLSCLTKSGRQVCRFSRAAQQALAQFLEESSGELLLRIGNAAYRVPEGDAAR